MEAAQACLSLYLSKCHIVGNHMSRLIYSVFYMFPRREVYNILVREGIAHPRYAVMNRDAEEKGMQYSGYILKNSVSCS